MPPGRASSVVESDGIGIRDFVSRNFVAVAWNSRRPQLADKRVRQAITLATNREEIFEGLAREAEIGAVRADLDVARPSDAPAWSYEHRLEHLAQRGTGQHCLRRLSRNTQQRAQVPGV